MNKPKIAICYDFDSTLSTKNMQEFDFMTLAGLKPDEFWDKCGKYSQKHQSDDILTMMKLMKDVFRNKNIENDREYLNSLGKSIVFYDGVDTWFERVNNYAEKMGVELNHYIISSGLKEIIEGTPIAKYFDRIYASYYSYDANGKIAWPAKAVDFTNKTQYLYRINKGVLDVNDKSINDIMDQDSRPVPLTNIIYIGDSLTDIPSMRMIIKNGGNTICVYDKGTSPKGYVKDLLKNDKVNFVAEADYSSDSLLEKIVKEIIRGIKNQQNLRNITKYQKAKIDKK